jgi:hypothetical protein
MEQWEKDLRKKLELEVPQGCYKIGADNFICHTGKGGYIEYLVEIQRHIRKWNVGQGLMEQIKEDPNRVQNYQQLTEEIIDKYIEEIFKTKINKTWT